MEPHKIDDFSRALVTTEGVAPSRRRLLSGLAGLAGGLSAFAGLSLLETDAKKKRQAKKHKSKNAAHGHNASDTDAEKKKGKKKKKKCSKKKKKKGLCGPKPPAATAKATYEGPVFTVSGRTILDTTGDPVQIRGVNKMSVFDDNDPRGVNYFPQIALSKSNSVRIVWAINDDNGPTDVNDLAALIANCQANKMLPMIELHDATGDISMLPALADYWTRADVLAVISNAGGNLLINIGNEVGDDSVDVNQFIQAYTPVIQKMRAANIRTPLVVDAPDFGKNIDVFNNGGAAGLLAVDSNLIFSVHPYWGISDGANLGFIQGKYNAAVTAGYALILGEFSEWGAFAGVGNSICDGDGKCDWQKIVDEASSRSIGWYAWEWGPGNEDGVPPDPNCTKMNMTTAGTFATRQAGWAQGVFDRIAAQSNPIIG